MIVPDKYLRGWAGSGGIVPFIDENINPASIDLTLSGEFIELHSGKKLTADEITLHHGDAILACTQEYVSMPDDHAGTVYLKSSMARKGLDHALAGWIDPGFHGQITLELHAHRLITLTKGQRVIQLVLMQMTEAPEKGYRITGRYNGQVGPTEAK